MPSSRTSSARLPSEARQKSRRAVLDVLRALPRDYRLYCAPGLPRDAQARSSEPAADFILAHPVRGLLAIVLKQGEIVEEAGGLVSQYNPQTQAYRLVDPVRPATESIGALLQAFEPRAAEICPCGLVVVFTDTQRVEFNQPRAAFLFADDLNTQVFRARLDSRFREPAYGPNLREFREGFERLCAFLERHSDNSMIFAERAGKIRAEAEARRTCAQETVTHLREAAAAPVAEVPPQASDAALFQPDAGPVAADPLPLFKPLEIEKAERQAPVVAIPSAPPKKPQRLAAKSATASHPKKRRNVIEDALAKGEGEARLPLLQWVLIVGVASGVMGGMYFLARWLGAFLLGKG